MEKKVVIELTEQQANDLDLYLFASSDYRSREQQACEELTLELNEDGTPKYKNMASNAKFWKDMNSQMKKICEIVNRARFRHE
ncbi:hypothetical protein [Candidatus Stoquefichus massiliensis]|uniref:hypothetical protein n=1 Tax=Candidatus Stoquefichus massiliensis TaxID=1470350 RepID=UPI0004899E6F|nr:hypothetical protein [Candidatus Stoquefichus massiliensis]